MRFRFITFLFATLFLSSNLAFITAQTACIKGVILDSSNDLPLIGANFYIEELKAGTVAGNKGDFSLEGLSPGKYAVRVSYIGYQTQRMTVSLVASETLQLTIRLKADLQSLGEVVVIKKSEARRIREEAMPVTVLTAQQLTGSVSNVSDILSKTMGVTIRSRGGVGNGSRLSVRGLEGKRIGFFIDEAPISDNSDFIDINDIPLSMIDHIEIYKGVVPAKFGGSAMGGAVNVVLKEYPPRFLDVSYANESFNTHKVNAILKRNIPNTGIEWGGGGAYTFAANDYTMESPFQKGLMIKRDHDHFESIAVALNIKLRRKYFDELDFSVEGVKKRKELQGIFSNIRFAQTQAKVGVLSTAMKKKDFIIDGLDLNFSGGASIARINFIDTAMHRYSWELIPYNPVHAQGGETGFAPSFSTINKLHIGSKLNLNYIITTQHALNLNLSQTYGHADPHNDVKDNALGYQTDYPSDMNSLVIGLGYDYKSKNDRLLNSFTAKYYFYSMKTTLRKFSGGHPLIPIDFKKHYWGIGNALRYKIVPNLLGKIAIAYEVRTPTENELIGDGYFVAPASDLLPERGSNLNIGLIWTKRRSDFGIFEMEINLFGNYIKDMIRQVHNIYQTQYENFGQMRSLGVEAEVKADLTPYLYGYVNVTYQDLRDTRKYEFMSTTLNPTYKLRIPNIPYLMANCGLELHKENFMGIRNTNTRLFSDLSFVEHYFYDFEQSIYQERRIPRSLRLDLGLEYTFLKGKLIFSAKVGNVTGQKLFSEFNYPLPGRTYALKIRYVLH